MLPERQRWHESKRPDRTAERNGRSWQVTKEILIVVDIASVVDRRWNVEQRCIDQADEGRKVFAVDRESEVDVLGRGGEELVQLLQGRLARGEDQVVHDRKVEPLAGFDLAQASGRHVAAAVEGAHEVDDIALLAREAVFARHIGKGVGDVSSDKVREGPSAARIERLAEIGNGRQGINMVKGGMDGWMGVCIRVPSPLSLFSALTSTSRRPARCTEAGSAPKAQGCYSKQSPPDSPHPRG